MCFGAKGGGGLTFSDTLQLWIHTLETVNACVQVKAYQSISTTLEHFCIFWHSASRLARVCGIMPRRSCCPKHWDAALQVQGFSETQLSPWCVLCSVLQRLSKETQRICWQPRMCLRRNPCGKQGSIQVSVPCYLRLHHLHHRCPPIRMMTQYEPISSRVSATEKLEKPTSADVKGCLTPFSLHIMTV